MADEQALGNALMTFGQTGGNAVNQYFNEQIGAAQKAQENTLNMLKFRAEQDDKLQTRTETARHNVADETNAAKKTEQEGLYQQGELGVKQGEAADTAKYHQGELAVRGGELANQQRNTTSEIGHRTAEEQEADARLALEADKNKRAGGDAADKAAGELRRTQISHVDEQIKKLNPDGVDVKMLPDDKQQSIKALQKQRDDLNRAEGHALAGESAAGRLNAPLTGPNDPNAQGVDNEMADRATDIAPRTQPGKGGKPGEAVKADLSAVPSGALNYLKSNPTTAVKVQFDLKYGKGAALQVLGE